MRSRIFKGITWTAIGYVASQLLRLMSNLIMTRFLAPEYFGVMAIVNVFMIGLAMFSDLGLGLSIVQSKRGEDRDFLNTAWTIQILRGFVLFAVVCFLANPLADFYAEQSLASILPVAGLSCLISGFLSTKIFTNQRQIDLGRVTLIEIVSQAVTILIMVIWAAIHPSVWALVVGSLASSFFKVAASHYALPGERNAFSLNREAVFELIRFGKWIFLSTLIGFASNSAGSMIIAKFVSMQQVGLFSMAATLAKAVEQVYEQISNKILFPMYSEIVRTEPDVLAARIKKVRLLVMTAFLPALWFLIVFGQWVVDFLFDSRYQAAGWILQVFAIGLIPMVVSGAGPFYLALGNSRLMMGMSFIRFLSFVICMYLGWHLDGSDGVIVGMACYTFIPYFFDMWVQRAHGVLFFRLDVAGMLMSLMVVYFGYFS